MTAGRALRSKPPRSTMPKPAARLTITALQAEIGVVADGDFGPKSKAALFARLSNPDAPRLSDEDFAVAARRLGVPVGHIRGIRKIEAPRGPFDARGRPSILYERHKFRSHTVPAGRFDMSHPQLSGPPYRPGGYGSFASQYDRLAAACALDPEAGFRACSWGAFQVLGENAVALGYASAWDMAKSLVVDEAAHLETFIRYVETNGLVDELRSCRADDPASCQPFVARYNGPGYRQFNYDVRLAEAIAV